MNLSRRTFLKRSGGLAAAAALGPGMLRSAFGAPTSGPRNVIFVELFGGNDGLNTVIPWAMNDGAYYTWRKSVGVKENQLLKIGSTPLAFHPALAPLVPHFQQGRLAIAQGVGYPEPNLSHAWSQKIWHTGDPVDPTGDGFLMKFLAQFPAPSFPAAAEVAEKISGLLSAPTAFVPALTSIGDFVFPFDPAHLEDAPNRRAAFEKLVAQAAGSGDVGKVASAASNLLELIDVFQTVPAVQSSPDYPLHGFANGLKLIARLLNADLGLRYFHLGYATFDTHALQNADGFHGKQLGVLAQSLAAFHQDLTALGLADDTLVVVFSEFGRTLAENASGGTDHGNVNNAFVFGNAVKGGFLSAHPSLHPSQLVNGELKMQVDFRDFLGTVLAQWLMASPAQLAAVFPGYAIQQLDLI